jgi:ribosomal protein L9
MRAQIQGDAMRAPKGFGKNYFTLAAIQATVVQHRLSATSVRVQASHRIHTDREQEESENEELDERLCSSTFALPTHAGHCNCFYKRITRNRIRQNPKAKRLVQTYRYANSVTSPPVLPLVRHQRYQNLTGNIT